MFTRFAGNIIGKELFEPQQKVLLAVSGGIDSMVLLQLFEKSEFLYGVVHCNFQLRGDDSEKDEEFVKEKVTMHGVSFYCQRFETLEYARMNGISIEMAARELRYNYFEKVRTENGYDFLATAHHQDDLIETFFLNLSRKTGIRGLTGIKEKTGPVIRPLLFATRREIEEFARSNFVEFREDRTNSEVVYQRNFIRHRVLPIFSELNPSFRGNLAETMLNLRGAEEVYTFAIDQAKREIVMEQENGVAIHIDHLLNTTFPKTLLFEILSEYNFNPRVTDQVFHGLESAPGKQYFSKTHRLLKDREHLFITLLPGEEERIYYIEEDDIELFSPFTLTVEKIHAKDFQIDPSSNVACLDRDKLIFPLLIRKWQQGDYFQPLGMTGFKKLSDFFIDEKIPLHEKEKCRLLCSGQKIVWVMGYRIDNRYKITSKTTRILKLQILET